MRGSREARSITAALLVGSSVLAVLGAAERWLLACRGVLSWESGPCVQRQDHAYDILVPMEPWLPIGHAAELIGLAYLALAVAVILTPAALARRSTWWQALAVGVAGLFLAGAGAFSLASGLAGEAVTPPSAGLLFGLFYVVLPFVVTLGLFPRDADDRANGPNGAFTAWMVTLAMPICTAIWWPVSSHDTAPWAEGTMALPLLVAALSLRPWSRDRATLLRLVPRPAATDTSLKGVHMRGSREARSLTAALLVGSSVLAVLGAADRWAGICSRSTWRSDSCWERRDRLYDQLLPTDPWVPIGHAAELHGFSSLLLAAAVALMPAALGRRSTWWQALSVAASALVLAAAGAIALLAGLTGQVVEPPGMAVLGGLWFSWLPFLVPIGLFPLDADRRPVGPVGGLAVWLLAFAMPWPQLFFWGTYADETVPWTEAGIALPLVAVALLLRPWARQRSFSNQQRAHALSL